MTEIELIQDLIDRANKLPHRDSKELDALERRAEMVIRRVFGESSKYLMDLDNIHFYPMMAPADENWHNERWNSGKAEITNLFKTMLEELNLFGTSSQVAQVRKTGSPASNRVFIVHGHDEAMKQGVARVIEKLGLQPIILHEQPSQGRTVIEKLTDYADVSFAVVLLSPDDMAYTKKQLPSEATPRARQNVVFELGYFIGALGRNCVFPLYQEEKNFEMLSDYAGVVYVPYDKAGRWQFDLVKELKAHGYSIDANKLI